MREKWRTHGQERLIFELLRQRKSVVRTSARILVPVNNLNPMAIADSGASHVILLTTALQDDKSAKQVNERLAAGEITAVEAHVTIPLCPLERVFRKLQLTAVWTPKA